MVSFSHLLLALLLFLGLTGPVIQGTPLEEELEEASEVFMQTVMNKPEQAQESYLHLRNVRATLPWPFSCPPFPLFS